jgi:hypothetical protein
LWVEVAKGLDVAPPEGEVDNILMLECPNVQAEIEFGVREKKIEPMKGWHR